MSESAVTVELARLQQYWSRFWPSSDTATAVADTEVRLAGAVRAWGLRDVTPLGGGVVALVCSATLGASRDRREVVVKLSPRISGGRRLADEAAALGFWRLTDAVVDVLAVRDDGFTVLLERLDPGTTLEAAALPPEQMLIELGQLARRLASAGRPPARFAPLRDAADPWREAAGRWPGLVEELERLLATEDSLIHGDLHARNVLRHGHTWKVIDPHAPRADRHAEIQPLLEASLALPEQTGDDHALAERWLAVYADAAGLDLARTRQWTRVRARIEALAVDAQSAPDAEERAWAAGLHRLANALS